MAGGRTQKSAESNSESPSQPHLDPVRSRRELPSGEAGRRGARSKQSELEHTQATASIPASENCMGGREGEYRLQRSSNTVARLPSIIRPAHQGHGLSL